MTTHVRVTPEILERAGKWLEEPMPENEEGFEQAERDIEAILSGETGRRVQLEAAE